MIKLLLFVVFLSVALANPADLSCDFDHGAAACRYLAAMPDSGWLVLPRDNGAGNFLLLNKSNIVMSSYLTDIKGEACVKFDYKVFGAMAQLTFDIGRLRTSRGFDQEQMERKLFARNTFSSRVDQWQSFTKSLQFGNTTRQYRITIMANMEPGANHSTVAIDNLEFAEGLCDQADKQDNEVLECDFDGEAYNQNNISEVCPWIMTSSNMRVMSMHDFTTLLTGGALTFYGMPPMVNEDGNGELATLATPIAAKSGTHCLSFWLSTRVMGNLFAAYLLDSMDEQVSASTRLEPIVVEDDAAGRDTWMRHMVQVDSDHRGDKYLMLKLRALRNWDSTVNLDLLRLENAACPKPATCDFANGFCGFTNYKFDHSKHYRNTWFHKVSDAAETGRPAGKYAYAAFELFNEHAENIQSRLDSDVMRTTGDHCATFEYLVNDHVLALELVKMEYVNDIPIMRTMWTAPADVQTNTWITTQQDFKANMKSVSFQIAMSINATRESFVALKSMSVRTGPCNGLSNVTFEEVDFECGSTGHLRPRHLVCDGVEDCPMGEDEDEELCDELSCKHHGLPCVQHGERFCLADQSRFCDGHLDCDNGVDEDPRLCDKETHCEAYCMNDGECGTESQPYGCECGFEFGGKRCTVELGENDK